MKIPFLLPVGAAVGLVSACAPLTPVKDFAASTASAAKTTKLAYEDFNQKVVAARLEALKYDGRPINPSDLRGPLDAGQSRTRVQLLSALATYATGLETLANHTAAARIETAGAEIGTGLGTLTKTYSSATGQSPLLTTGEIAALSRTVTFVGQTWVRAKRERAVREVVQQADPAIQRSIALLATEMNQGADILDAGLREALAAQTSAYNRALQERTFSTVAEQQKAADAVAANTRNFPLAPAVFRSATEALREVAAAHGKLAKLAAAQKFDLAAFAGSVAELRALVEQLRTDLAKTDA